MLTLDGSEFIDMTGEEDPRSVRAAGGGIVFLATPRKPNNHNAPKLECSSDTGSKKTMCVYQYHTFVAVVAISKREVLFESRANAYAVLWW